MPAATTLDRPARRGHTPIGSSASGDLVLLVVAGRDLDRLAMDFASSRPRARSYCCAAADCVDFVPTRAVDLIVLGVDGSVMAGFVLAAQLRTADIGRGSVAIVAATSSECTFQDCLVIGSAIDGALKVPCDLQLFAGCVDRWCLEDDVRSRRLPAGPDRASA